MHVAAGEKSMEEKEKRKQDELAAIIKDIFRNRKNISYTDLVNELITALDIKERTAKAIFAT